MLTPTKQQALFRFNAWLNRRAYPQRSIHLYGNMMLKFLAALSHDALEKISDKDVEKYVDSMHEKDTHYRQQFTAVVQKFVLILCSEVSCSDACNHYRKSA